MLDTMTIAQTIRNQIGRNTLMCIAAHNFVALGEDENRRGGLAFKVGRNPKLRGGGSVFVSLNGKDLYDVTIKNNRGRTVKHFSDVFCESLGGPDGVIESVTG